MQQDATSRSSRRGHIRGAASQRILRRAASSAAVIAVPQDSVRGVDRKSPVHAVDVEQAAAAHDLVPINEAFPTLGAMAVILRPSF